MTLRRVLEQRSRAARLLLGMTPAAEAPCEFHAGLPAITRLPGTEGEARTTRARQRWGKVRWAVAAARALRLESVRAALSAEHAEMMAGRDCYQEVRGFLAQTIPSSSSSSSSPSSSVVVVSLDLDLLGREMQRRGRMASTRLAALRSLRGLLDRATASLSLQQVQTRSAS